MKKTTAGAAFGCYILYNSMFHVYVLSRSRPGETLRGLDSGGGTGGERDEIC